MVSCRLKKRSLVKTLFESIRYFGSVETFLKGFKKKLLRSFDGGSGGT